MEDVEDDIQETYLAECAEHLATFETDLLALQKLGGEIDEEIANRLLRAMHSVRGVIFFDLATVGKVAHQIEEVLMLIRSRQIILTPDGLGLLLGATDRLRELLQNHGTSNYAEVAELMADLDGMSLHEPVSAGGQEPQGGSRLRILLVEDDVPSRLVLHSFLSRYGDCRIAVNGTKAVDAVRATLERGQKYDLICMDIMMPELNGIDAVRQIRALEEAHGFSAASGERIIMTTAVNDMREVIQCFQEFCGAYLLKPIDLQELLTYMRFSRLIE